MNIAAPATANGARSDDRATAAEERRFDLLRKIAEAGGRFAPVPSPAAPHGFSYAALGDDILRDLSILARRDYLEQRFFERVSLCPKCDSHHLNVREICPGCRRSNLTADGLLHHFRCGYVGIPSEYTLAEDRSYICPKCNGKLRHIGTEYDRLGKAFVCRGCGVISENPPVEAHCYSCGAHTPADNLVSAVVHQYLLTSRGAAAIRRGSLADDGEEEVSAADAPVYRRTMILEFLNQEMKRSQSFKNVFSVLLLQLARETAEQLGSQEMADWVAKVRSCLREVDLIGQLADELYVVVLPQMKRGAADGVRQAIERELGSNSPVKASVMEIDGPRRLAQAIAGLGGREKP
jgi:hypothetical protein